MNNTATASRDERTAVEKALSLLEAFGADAPTGMGVSALARRAQLSKSTAFRLLALLERKNAVERVGTSYRIGPMLNALGAGSDSRLHDTLRDFLTPYLAELYEQTRQTVHLAVLTGTEVIYLNKLHGHRRVPTPSKIGGRVPAYRTAVGKTLLALNEVASTAAGRGTFDAPTPTTITGAAQLERELDDIRRRGVAYDNGESLPELVCVAAPVMGPQGRPVAAFSVAGQRGFFSPEEQAEALRRLCFAASRALSTVSR
ncbi:IclR family transcriptional regulator [Klugiella xanthotipulae]|uniref:IclR family transcriptional regulator n=1 Tax=Klugiella xanthotipulae TaxID=244735 RepID=A0A543I458_9MICO|nr:IclR family transcriptional regulator [Klugiella xanthotipulae]TQM65384.1 IclR family transcriptional regulator [Klugiella xanthotipulae]